MIRQKRDEYEAPRAMRLSHARCGRGLCMPGSGDLDACYGPGTSALVECVTVGNTAGGNCISTGNDPFEQ